MTAHHDHWHGARSHLYRVLGVLLAVLLLVGVFWSIQPINSQEHQRLMSEFAKLQHNEARLGELTLELNFRLANNYDDINETISQLTADIQSLKTAQANQKLREDVAFVLQLARLEQKIIDKKNALEQFKSRNAILKNSLMFLPKVRDDLIPLFKNDHSITLDINRVIEQVLLQRINNTPVNQTDIELLAEDLTTFSQRMSDEQQKSIRLFIRHTRLVTSISEEMNQLVPLLLSDDNINALINTYHQYYQHRQALATVYQWFLLAALVLLGIFAFRIAVRFKENAQQLKLASTAFNHSSEGIMITDNQQRIIAVNPSFTLITGYTPEEVIGNTPKLLSSGQHDKGFYQAIWQSIQQTGNWQGEIWNKRKDGTIYPESLSISSVPTIDNAGVSHYIASIRDISISKQNEEAIYQLAFYDPLTKLPNRRLLIDRLERKLTHKDETFSALLFIDLDNFKILNDTKGHDIGDLMLIEVAQRLKELVPEQDTVARLGGDEFVIMLESVGDDAEQAIRHSKHIAESMLRAINTPFNLGHVDYSGSCSIGIRLFRDKISIEELFKHADTAMYEAKQAGRNRMMFFDPLMQHKLETYAALETDIQQALGLAQFELFYQIQVDANHHATGAEVLLRWRHPERGLVFPDQFIPLLEETGLIVPVGLWILRTACYQLKHWQQKAPTRYLVLAVNVSARQFAEPSLVNQIKALLLETEITPSCLKLEITESILLTDIEAIINTMYQLKGLGVRFSMDDFGTGYSSLQYLKRLPLDQLKIDQSFVRDMGIDNNDDAIVSTIIAMAHSLGLSVIAEGVETEMQRNLLLSQGCHHFQGYLFSKPIPLSEFEALLEQIGSH